MENQRKFTTKQFGTIVFKAVNGMKDMRSAKKVGLISKSFSNHIFLVVTEVNGCAICSYKHSKDALEMGMSQEELENYLSGDVSNADAKETAALLFAQHYAESSGKYSKKAFKRIVQIYGKEMAKGILGNIRVIMMGNAYGIETAALGNRLKGKPVEHSRLRDELGVTFSVFLFLPMALIANAMDKII